MLSSALPLQQDNSLSAYGEAFLDYLWDKKLKNIDQVRIWEACKKIEKDFLQNKKKRRTGESYEEHPYEVAHILLDLADRADIDTDTIIACLFHDHIEDIHADTHETLKNNYNSYIAFVVHLLSKEDIEEGLSVEEKKEAKKKRNESFFKNFINKDALENYIIGEAKKVGFDFTKKHSLEKITKIVSIIKICDRIHNLFTMPMTHFSIEDINGKIQETEEYIVFLAQQFSRGDTKILDMLRKAILYAIMQKNSWKTNNALSQ